VGAEVTYQLPLGASSRFTQLFRKLEDQQQEMGVRSFGLSVTTLEEVFIRVAEATHRHDEELSSSGSKGVVGGMKKVEGGEGGGVAGGAGGADHLSPQTATGVVLASSPKALPPLSNEIKLAHESMKTVFMVQFKALLIKRILCLSRDLKMWLLQYILPILLVLTGLLLSKFLIGSKKDQPNLELSLTR